jgi:hypothetical protein
MLTHGDGQPQRRRGEELVRNGELAQVDGVYVEGMTSPSTFSA